MTRLRHIKIVLSTSCVLMVMKFIVTNTVIAQTDDSSLTNDNLNDGSSSNKNYLAAANIPNEVDSSGWSFGSSSLPENTDTSAKEKPSPLIKIARVDEVENDIPETPQYVDQLIDPTTLYEADDQVSVLQSNDFGFYQNVDVVFYAEDDSTNQQTITESALAYTAILPTNNYGQIIIKAVALDESDKRRSYSSVNQSQQGLRRLSIEQIGMPLTETLVMDNILGTHRTSWLRSHRYQTSLINQRLGAVEPDIAGITSRLRYKNSSVTLSAGEVGENRGALLPGFLQRDGTVVRSQFYGATEWNAFSADFWKTDDFINDDRNISGGRLNWSAIWKRDIVSSIGWAQSDESTAILAGLSQQKDEFRQELGVYYFDPKFVWIDKQIGDDNAGVYYRLNNQRGRLSYGVSTEYRQDGLAQESISERETLFLAGNLSYRLNLNSRLHTSYSYRDTDNISQANNSFKQYYLRAGYTTRHDFNTNSNLSGSYRQRNFSSSSVDTSVAQLYYGLTHAFLNDTNATLGLDYSREDSATEVRDLYNISTSWQVNLSNGSNLSFGGGYNYSTGDLSTDKYWTAQANLDWPINDKLSLSANLDYNRSIYEFDDDIQFDGLFTNDFIDFDDENVRESNRVSATIYLSYNFGKANVPSVLSSRNGLAGSGSIRGRLYVDENADGIRQANEPGLSGVTVYLDSVYPTTTDSDGRYNFQRVGTGDHRIFIDERKLPLPYTLNEQEFYNVAVRLRASSIQDIAVKVIQ